MAERVSIERGERASAVRLSVIVPSLSGAIPVLRSSLAAQTLQDFELILVVGAQPAARARNLGAGHASGEILVFIDDDATFGHPAVLAQLWAQLRASPTVGVVGPSKQLSAAATPLQRQIAAQVPRWVYPVLSDDTESNPPLNEHGFSGITTTCCAMRRTDFVQIGGFDEALMTGEDPEFFYRVRQAGYRFVIPAYCWVCHDPPNSLEGLVRKSFFYGVGHAQQAHKNADRKMHIVPVTGLIGTLLLLISPLLWLPLLFIQPYFEPKRHWRFRFQPLKALSTTATYYGYARETRRLRRLARRSATPVEGVVSSSDYSASRSSTISGVTFFSVAILNNIYAIIMAALLPVAAYGVLGLAQAWLLIAATLLSAGFPWELTRALARGGRRDEIYSIAKGVLLGNLGLAVALSLILLLATRSGVIMLDAADTPIVWLLIGATLLLALTAFWASVLRGALRFGAVGAALFAEAVIKLTAGALLALAGLGALGPVIAMILGTIVTAVILAWTTRRFTFWKAAGWGRWQDYRSALVMLTGLGALALLGNIDIIGVKLFSPAHAADQLAGYYQPAVVLARIPLLLAGAYAGTLFPYLAREQGTTLDAYTWQTLKYTLLLLVPLQLILIAIPAASLDFFFPEQYLVSASTLRIAASATLLLSLSTILATILQARGLARVAARWLLAAVLGEILALALLIPIYGNEGAALALLIGGGLAFAGLALGGGRQVYIPPPVAARVIGYGLACAALVVLLVALPHGSIMSTSLTALTALTIYGVVLAATGVLRADDLMTITSGLPLDRFPLTRLARKLGLHVVVRLNRLSPGITQARAEQHEAPGP